MAKFKKALALVLSLAMVLTLAPIANVQTEAASKYKIKAATTAIAAEKTYNVKVTGVAKTQYVKIARSAGVTVKYNSKTIKASKKVVGTGKTLTFKVTVPDKVANYKSTIKAVIYNKKTNKKVKTLSTKRTVKVSEFSVTSVAAATEAANNKYIIAKFSKALSSLDASEVTISDKATGQLYTVEKVALASNGKSATITLLGDALASGDTFLAPNTDYVFTVTQSSVSASCDFYIPSVYANAQIVAVNPTLKTVTVAAGSGTSGNGAAGTYTDKDGLVTDYNEVLGRTVTISYDKNNMLTRFDLAKETVVYGAFESVNDGTAALNVVGIKDVTTKTTYSLGAGNGSIFAPVNITGLAGANNSALSGAGARIGSILTAEVAAGHNTAEYAKVVLNADNSVRAIVSVAAFASGGRGGVYVKSTSEDLYIVDAKGTHISLKDYNILKDGKTITVKDIAEGDIVFFDSTVNKVAEVFNGTKVSGKLATYAAKFDVDSTRYDLAGDLVVGSSVSIGVTAADLSVYDGTNVDVFFRRNGTVAQIIATDQAANTASSYAVITKAAKIYSVGSKLSLAFSADDGTGAKDYVIDPSTLTSVTTKGGTVLKKSNTQSFNIFATAAEGATTAFDASTFDGSLTLNTNATPATAPTAAITIDSTAGGTTGSGLADLAAATENNDMSVGQLVKLTKKDDGTVTAIELADPDTSAAPGATAADDQIYTGATGVETIGAGTDFKKGLTYIQVNSAGTKYSLSANTPVITYSVTDSKVAVTKYGEIDFSYALSATHTGLVRFDRNTSAVSAIVIWAGGAYAGIGQSSIDKVLKSVVVSVTTDVAATKIVELVAYNGTEKTTYKDFANDVAPNAAIAAGEIVNIELTKDGKVYGVGHTGTAFNAVTAPYDLGGTTGLADKTAEDYSSNTLDTTIPMYLKTDVTNTIVTFDGTTVAPISWYEYDNLDDAKTLSVTYSRYADTTNYADVVVVTTATAAVVTATAEVNAAAAALNAAVASGGIEMTGGAATSYTLDAANLAAIAAANNVTITWALSAASAGAALTVTSAGVLNSTGTAAITPTITGTITSTTSAGVTATVTATVTIANTTGNITDVAI